MMMMTSEKHGQRDGHAGDSGPWIRTNNGGRFYYLSSDGNQYDIDVAVAALSRLCRYGGHLKNSPEIDDEIYSVAQHSVYVFRLMKKVGAPKVTLPWAVSHDIPEAYFVDLPSPLKSLITAYGELEDKSAEAFRTAYDIPFDPNVHDHVKWADNQLYFAERLVLTEIPPGEEDLAPRPKYTLEEIDPDFYLWRPKYARQMLKEAFVEAMTLYHGEKYAYAS